MMNIKMYIVVFASSNTDSGDDPVGHHLPKILLKAMGRMMEKVMIKVMINANFHIKPDVEVRDTLRTVVYRY